MRWEVEAWRKLYKTEPVEQLLWNLLCRGLRDYLIRRAADDGVLFPSTKDPADDLCQALGARDSERDIVRTHVQTMLDDRFLVHRTDGALVVRNLVEAQTRRSKEAARKAAQRERKRAPEETGTPSGTVPGTSAGTGPGLSRDKYGEKKRIEKKRENPPNPPGGQARATPPKSNGAAHAAEPPTESGFDLALRCFRQAWGSRYGEEYLVGTNTGDNGDERVLQRVGREALRLGGEPVMRHWAQAYVADTEPWLVEHRHPARALERQLNKYATRPELRVVDTLDELDEDARAKREQDAEAQRLARTSGPPPTPEQLDLLRAKLRAGKS